jgi:hypothetical protein
VATPACLRPERLVRLNWAQGIHKFFITDDNFARNKEWEAIFDRLIELRELHGIPLGLMIQVDTLCHKIANFVEKAKRAGVTRVFIGLENINPDNLAAAKKRQNKITEYRKMPLAWKAQGIITFAGYILGFPSDTRETIRRDIAIIKKELPLDGLEFFCLTPLPGSEDHKVLWAKGVPMDADLNKYDAEHVCTGHPKMSKQEWEAIYREAWSLYYTPEHMHTLLRRAAATGVPMHSLVKVLVTFATAVRLENMHPLQTGILRLKHPSERRPGLPRCGRTHKESRRADWRPAGLTRNLGGRPRSRISASLKRRGSRITLSVKYGAISGSGKSVKSSSRRWTMLPLPSSQVSVLARSLRTAWAKNGANVNAVIWISLGPSAARVAQLRACAIRNI